MADGDGRRPSASETIAPSGRRPSASASVTDDTQEEWTCVRCNLKSRSDDVPMLECNLCNTRTCTKCAKINNTAYKVLARQDIMWFCTQGCTTAANKAINQRRSDTKEQMDIASGMQKLEATISGRVQHLNTILYQELQQTMYSIEEAILTKIDKTNAISQSWAEKVQNGLGPTIVNAAQSTNELTTIMKVAIEETKQNDRMMDDKQRSIIIYKVEESKKENADERKKEEEDIVDRLCNEGARVQGCKVTKMFRLGKYDKDKNQPRPLKVTFEMKEQQQKLLANLRNLKEADEDLKRLSISPDLTKEARAEIKIKVEEAKELTKNSKDSVFKVRGNSGHLRLVEIKNK